MAGFPTRPSRDAFGPTYEDERPVRNPKRELGSAIGNLMFWQLAGAGIVAPMGVIQVAVTGGVATTVYQALAFDPKGQLALLTWINDATGQYTITFASTYPDETGTARPFAVRFGDASVIEGTADDRARVTKLTDQKLQVQLFAESGLGTRVDRDFILKLW